MVCSCPLCDRHQHHDAFHDDNTPTSTFDDNTPTSTFHDENTPIIALLIAMASGLTLARAADLFAAHRAATLSALGIAIVLPLAVNDYRTYLSYG